MTKYTVTYFPIKALAEPIRLLLSYGLIPFEDKRITFEEWPALKAKTPLGQLPIVEIDGQVRYQSTAICRYLGKLVKLAGDNDDEALMIDIAVETISDFRSKVAAANYELDPEIKEWKFNVLAEEAIPFYIQKLEAQVAANDGYFACKKLTWADFYFVGILDYLNHVCRKDITVGNPNLDKVRKTVLALPLVEEWYKTAPPSDF